MHSHPGSAPRQRQESAPGAPLLSREPHAPSAHLYIRLYFSRDIRALCFAIIGMSTRADYNHEITRLQIENNIDLFRVHAYAIAVKDSSRRRCRKKQIVFHQSHCLHLFARRFAENRDPLRVIFTVDAKRTHQKIGDFPVERAYRLERNRSARGLRPASWLGRKYSSGAMSFLHDDMRSDGTGALAPQPSPRSRSSFNERHFPYASAWPKRHSDKASLLQTIDSNRIDRPACAVMRSNPLRVPRPRPTGSCSRRASR